MGVLKIENVAHSSSLDHRHHLLLRLLLRSGENHHSRIRVPLRRSRRRLCRRARGSNACRLFLLSSHPKFTSRVRVAGSFLLPSTGLAWSEELKIHQDAIPSFAGLGTFLDGHVLGADWRKTLWDSKAQYFANPF